MTDVHYLVGAAGLTWIMLLSASLLRARGWTPAGLVTAFGNRDALGEPSPVAARADRAAKNMLENLVLFATLVLAARSAGADAATTTGACAIFVGARVVYFAVYLAGIPYVRTAVWGVSLVGLVQLGVAAVTAG
jgi:uncharacterized MAPEG superfamily protein